MILKENDSVRVLVIVGEPVEEVETDTEEDPRSVGLCEYENEALSDRLLDAVCVN